MCAFTRRVKSYSASIVFTFSYCLRKTFRRSLTMSAGELALCCGQVAAVNGGGQVAGLNWFGLESSVAPKSDTVVRFHAPGIRKFSKRKVSVKRSRSVARMETPKSAVAEMRCVKEFPVVAKSRWRVRVIRPPNNSPNDGMDASASE